MGIQYAYALLTMLPCPIWFWYRWASTAFMMIVFIWATYNGATFYIDVFGKRMNKEVEALRKEVAKWQNTPEGRTLVDATTPSEATGSVAGTGLAGGDTSNAGPEAGAHARSHSVDNIPLLDQKDDQKEGASTARDVMAQNHETIRQR